MGATVLSLIFCCIATIVIAENVMPPGKRGRRTTSAKVASPPSGDTPLYVSYLENLYHNSNADDDDYVADEDYFSSEDFYNAFTMLSPPKMNIFRKPKDREKAYMAGEEVSMKCEASGDPAPTYRWKKDGVLIDLASLGIKKRPGVGDIVIKVPTEQHEGTYQCIASNSYGTAISPLLVLKRAFMEPFQKSDIKIHKPIVGTYLTLPCHPPRSYPSGLVYWGEDKPGAKFKIIPTDKRVAVDYNGNLHFANVKQTDNLGIGTKYVCISENPAFRSLVKGDDKQVTPERQPGNLHFANVKMDDTVAGAYVCMVQNSALRSLVEGDDQQIEPIQSQASTFYEAPKLRWNSETPTIAIKGDTKQMKCIFSGYPTPSVTWKKLDGRGDLPGNMQMDATNMEITITNVQPEDEGRYECSATNSRVGGSVTKQFDLRVEVMPFWIDEIQDQTSAEEEDVEFQCKAGGSPQPSLSWTINAEAVSERPYDPRYTFRDNSITIRNLTKADTMVIQCNASNKHGYQLKNAYLNVRADPPSFTEAPKAVTKVAQGQDVIIKCRVYGAPKPKITWKKGFPPHDEDVRSGMRYTIHANGDLQIFGVISSDDATYQCLAENKFGKEDASGQLIVRNRTVITEQPADMTRNASTDIMFKCNGTTDKSEYSNLKYEWLRNGEKIDFTKEGRISMNVQDNSLKISQAHVEDTGQYTCRISNGIDSDEATAQLTIRDRPDPPQKLKLSSCTSSKADLSWEPGSENNDEVLEFIVYYNTSFDEDGVFHVASQVGKGIHRTYINLSPWANYTFHVKARNSLGLSESSLFSAVCATPAMIPYQNPKNVCARSERPDQLVIVWDKMEKIDHNGEGFHYVVTYQRTEGMHPQVVERVDDWEQTKLVVDGQPTFVAYEIQVQARNVKGFAPVRTLNRYRVYSGEDTPLDSPQGFQLDESTLNSTSAEFTWDPVDESPARVRGHFKGYRIRFWKTDDPDQAREEDIILNPVEMCPVIQAGRRKKRAAQNEVRAHTHKLWPYSALSAGVLVLNGGKTGDLSNVISFNTPEGLPGIVSRFVISETGSHHLKLVWEPPMEPNGILTGYTVAYREVGGRLIYENVDDPFRSHYKIHDLKEETDYIIYLMAKTIVGRGPRMHQESRTLAAGVPDVPAIGVFAAGDDHVNVSWVPSSGRQENPGSEFYIEYKKEGDDGPWQSTDPERQHNWINVTDLEPGATYEVRIVARNGRGDESRSPPTLIQIGPKTGEQTDPVTSAGWFIGIMLALIFLILVLIIVCLIRKNRGGKYPVHEKEKLAGHDPEKEDAEQGFGEYTKTPYMPLRDSDEPAKKKSTGSLNSEEKPLESDTDSMAEYYETDPSKFNEDGSFIGQYGGKKTKEADTTSPSALSTFV